MKTTTLGWALPGLVFAAGFTFSAACGSDIPPAPPCADPSGGNGSGAGGSGAGGGPSTDPNAQEINARLHGCSKVRYTNLGALLVERGVDITDFGGSLATCRTDGSIPCSAGEQCYCPTAPCSGDAPNDGMCVASPGTPGFLYASGDDAFGVPTMDSRRGEKDGHTTASALKLFDIFVQAAPQIIANIEDPERAPACVLDGASFPVFDHGDGACVPEAISCLIGTPATDDHILLCNLILAEANPSSPDASGNGVPDDVDTKRHIAIATLMSAAHSCE
jgi:hypothetical protein